MQSPEMAAVFYVVETCVWMESVIFYLKNDEFRKDPYE